MYNAFVSAKNDHDKQVCLFISFHIVPIIKADVILQVKKKQFLTTKILLRFHKNNFF